MQYGLITKGFQLPRFGPDGKWGDETQGAYDTYIASLSNENPTFSNCVIDLSHHNRVADFQKVKADGIVGVIHKATQGFRYKDPKYKSRRAKALDAGLLWGAYHFGVGGDGETQARHFLDNVDANDLLVLDFENNPSGSSMTLNEAGDFVEFIHDKTGRWPGFYSGHYVRELLGNSGDAILSNCWLWAARYGNNSPIIPAAWAKWTMWQYTDGAAGPEPHTVDGVGHCDRDKFNGSLEEMKTFWS
ncbi:MAG: glycoside hydrolase [Desulfobacterales bacterium]|nr:glycoside hydrolase [Desulfobacterales bacterium]